MFRKFFECRACTLTSWFKSAVSLGILVALMPMSQVYALGVSLPSPSGVKVLSKNSSVQVSWNQIITPNTGRQISYIASTSDNAFYCVSTESSCVIQGLTNGETYEIVVKAKDGILTSLNSVSSTVVVGAKASILQLYYLKSPYPDPTRMIFQIGVNDTYTSDFCNSVAYVSLNNFALDPTPIDSTSEWQLTAVGNVWAPRTVYLYNNPSKMKLLVSPCADGTWYESDEIPLPNTKTFFPKPNIELDKNSWMVSVDPNSIQTEGVFNENPYLNLKFRYAISCDGNFINTEGSWNGYPYLDTNPEENMFDYLTGILGFPWTDGIYDASTSKLSIPRIQSYRGCKLYVTYDLLPDVPLSFWWQGIGPIQSDVASLEIPEATIASAPTIQSIVPQDGGLLIDFAFPQNDGGATISNYQYSVDGGLSWTTKSPAQISSPLNISNLINGTTYSVKLRAVNSAGAGVESNLVSAIPRSAPGSPEITSVVSGNRKLTINFDRPNYSGGADITRYELSIDGGLSWSSMTDLQNNSSREISGLINGVTYPVAVRAVNVVGYGPSSNVVLSTPITTANAPSAVTIVSGNRQALVHFNPPSDNGGAPITNYEYSLNGGSTWTSMAPSRTTSPLLITGLTNGTAYSVKIRAVSKVGSGAPSDAVSTTPYTIANAPTITSVTAGNHEAIVSFKLPVDTGGSAVSNYEYSTDGGSTWSPASPEQTSSPLVISGLTNGSTYSVKVRAVNSAGSGSASNAISVKPIAPASAPTISGVTAGNGQATLSITAPSQINDSALSGYDYSTNNGSTWSHFASVTGPFTITGLTNATAYQVKVRAVNSAGAGEASGAVTVNPTRLVPAKPVIASVVGGNASATVNITTPTDVTAQSITGYQYSIDKGATYQNAPVSNGTFTINGLTNGVSTSVQIRATNFNGNSLASVAKTVVPATTPAAPSITTITPSTGALSIAFTAPNTGGSAITSYQYSLDGGSTWVVPKTAIKTSPIKVTGLPNATSYQIKIRAVNAKGTGLSSDVVNASTPVLVPSAPVTTSIAKTSTTFTVDVTAPINNGGGAITNYAYSVDSGKTWTVVSPASNSTRIVITGLTPNKIYPVQIAAINSAGRGAASAKYNAGTLR